MKIGCDYNKIGTLIDTLKINNNGEVIEVVKWVPDHLLQMGHIVSLQP